MKTAFCCHPGQGTAALPPNGRLTMDGALSAGDVAGVGVVLFHAGEPEQSKETEEAEFAGVVVHAVDPREIVGAASWAHAAGGACATAGSAGACGLGVGRNGEERKAGQGEAGRFAGKNFHKVWWLGCN